MALYNALVNIGDFFFDVYGYFRDKGIELNGVYLIGSNLAAFFITIAVRFSMIGSQFYKAADNWLDAWNDLKNGVNLPFGLDQLLYWADDLVQLVRGFDNAVMTAIKRYFPRAARLLDDPSGEIIDIIIKYTGFSYNFIFRPFDAINNLINSAMGELREIASDPEKWLINNLRRYFSTAWDLLTDPERWMSNFIKSNVPNLSEFLRDPDTFIIEKVISMLESVLSRYEKRLAKIAENILNRIF